MQAQEHFLARDLGGPLLQRGVGDLILRKEPDAGRHPAGEVTPKVDHTVAGQGGDHEKPVKRQPLRRFFSKCKQLFLVNLIDLVECQREGI